MISGDIIISPSGKFYGSENVLLDFIYGSDRPYIIYVPKNSLLSKKLLSLNQIVREFENIRSLYLSVFNELLWSKKNVYLNEAGHISYIKFLSGLFPKRNFVVSVRLLSDCNKKLLNLQNNITLVAVSHYIESQIISKNPVEVIYDPYRPHKNKIVGVENHDFIICVVGRVNTNKGLDAIFEVLKHLKEEHIEKAIFRFFGDFDETSAWFLNFKKKLNTISKLNFQFLGFEENQNIIYSESNLLLHLNQKEPLGRIVFEAIDYNVPFVCFNSGGLGELVDKLNLTEHCVDTSKEMAKHIIKYLLNNSLSSIKYDEASRLICNEFSPRSYAKSIERFLDGDK